MCWQYSVDGETRGPVGWERLRGLIDAGQLSPLTPVWREGMDDWRPFAEVRDDVSASDDDLFVAPEAPPTREVPLPATTGRRWAAKVIDLGLMFLLYVALIGIILPFSAVASGRLPPTTGSPSRGAAVGPRTSAMTWASSVYAPSTTDVGPPSVSHAGAWP